MYYNCLDVHKRKISYCVKDSSAKVFAEGSLPARRLDLDLWMKTTVTAAERDGGSDHVHGLDYDHPKSHFAALKVAHPLMLRAIAAAMKTNDRVDAGKIFDCLRCDFLPESYMAPSAGARCATATCWCARWCRRTSRPAGC
jgi:transposase